jgi:hypothetical protein
VARSVDCSCTGPRTYSSISPWTPQGHRPVRSRRGSRLHRHALGRRFTNTALLALAREVDCGFDIGVFIDMLRQLARYCDVDLALGDVDIAALRAFFRQWITDLHPPSTETRAGHRSAFD